MIYWGATDNAFTNWDDPEFITGNARIRSLTAANIISIFTPEVGLPYQPLWILSYAVDYHFWGLDPQPYIVHNIVLHGAAATILLFLLFHMLDAVGVSGRGVRGIAFLTTMLFVVHPVNVESVSWACSRKYGLMAVFYFLSLLCYMRANASSRYMILWRGVAVVAAIVAMLANPFAITLPAVLLLFEYCRSGSSSMITVIKRRFSALVPFAVVLFGLLPVHLMVLVADDEQSTSKSHYMDNRQFTFYTMLRVLFDYLRNLTCPAWLNNRYFDRVSESPFEWKVVLSIVLLAACSYLVWRRARLGDRRPLLCAGWFFITWSPVSNLIPISTKMADRYMYMPAVGLFLGASIVVVARFQLSRSKRIRVSSVIASVALLATFAMLARARTHVWANSVALWSDSIAVDFSNDLAHIALANALRDLGKDRDAAEHYRHALVLNPGNATANNNLGNALRALGRLDLAAVRYRRAIALSPGYADAHYNLGAILDNQGIYADAIHHYRAALAYDDLNDAAHNNLGYLYARQGELKRALDCLKRAVEIDPGNDNAQNNLGLVLVRMGREADGFERFRKALASNPGNPEAHYNLGLYYQRRHEPNDAMRHYREACRLKSDFAEARLNSGNILLENQDYAAALAEYRETLRIRPDYTEAHNNIGTVYFYLGQRKLAIDHFSRALEIDPSYRSAQDNLKAIR